MANTNTTDEEWLYFMQDMPTTDLMSAARTDWDSTIETKQDFTDRELDQWLNQNYFTDLDTNVNVEHTNDRAQAQTQAQILSPPFYAAFDDRGGLQSHEAVQCSQDQAVQPSWSEAELRSAVRTLQLELDHTTKRLELISEYLEELQPWTFLINSLVHGSDERPTVMSTIGGQINPASPTCTKIDMTGGAKWDFGRGKGDEFPGPSAEDATRGTG